jgi:ATPase family associated with various cellular activities (AAA)
MNTAPATGVAPIKPRQLQVLLAQSIPAKFPVLIKGAPGVGKTDCVTQASLAANADITIMHPVVKDPTDFKGMPWVTAGNASFLPFGDLKKLIHATNLTICFLDDLGQATNAVQAAAMQLILGREIDGHRVSDQVVFIAATNRREDRAGVLGLLEPVKSRFVTIVELIPDLNDWCRWAVQESVAPEVIAFLRFRPDLFSDFRPTADLSNTPSPRTWHHVSKLLSLSLPSDLQRSCIQGAVGEGAGLEFFAFLDVWSQMVSPDLILTAPDTAPIPTELSALCAVSTAIATRVQPSSMTRYCRYLERLCAADHEEYAALSMKAAVTRDPKLTSTPGYVTAMSGRIGQLMVGA